MKSIPLRPPTTVQFLQSGAALAALIAVVVVGGEIGGFLRADASDRGSMITIGIEHASPLGLRMEFGAMPGSAISEITSESEEEIFLSVPDSWVLQEVRRARIADITFDPPTLGFRRLRFPAKVSVTFALSDMPSGVTIANPSGVPLKIEFVRVELPSEEVLTDVVLVQEGSAQLW